MPEEILDTNQVEKALLTPELGLELKHSYVHWAPISQIQWSPNGEKLAISSKDGTVSILDIEYFIMIFTFNCYSYFINKLKNAEDTYNKNDKYEKLLKSIYIKSKDILLNIVWSPDGKKLALSAIGGIIAVIDLVNEEPIFSLNCQNFFKKKDKFYHNYLYNFESIILDKFSDDYIRGMEWSLDGDKFILLLSDGRFVVISTKTWKISRISRNVSDFYQENVLKGQDRKNLVSLELNNILNLNSHDYYDFRSIDTRLSYIQRSWKKLFSIKNINGSWWAYSKNNRSFAFSSPNSSTMDIFMLAGKNGILQRFHTKLEGHIGNITSISFSYDGKFLASKSLDDTFRIWECKTWETLAVIPELASNNKDSPLMFHPNAYKLATVGESGNAIHFWNFNLDILYKTHSVIKTVHYTSAKVVLVGESNVGKSCLALRLAEDRYEELGTTHGTRVWSMQPEQLSSDAIFPEGKKCDIVLWDMGGQDEYRLVHQLFLHDVALALILLDPTRGRTAFDEVEGWSKRLDKQLGNRKATKLLVGTKLDEDGSNVDRIALVRLVKDCKIVGYYPISAKMGRGLSELRAAIYKSLDWDSLSNTSRPELFQQIRDEIKNLKNENQVVISFSDFEKRMRQKKNIEYNLKAIDEVVKQLAVQGAISDIQIDTGERMLVLQIGEIERYAGSIIIAAKNNPRGVPAIEKLMVASPQMSFPCIKDEQRLARIQERVVLECVMQLLIEHGICLQHEGLLIFPSLFQPTEKEKIASIPHSISLYYDFSGAIDNIYSSLVAWLAISGHFGRHRLWEDRAEFEMTGQGACGLRKINRGGGFAHLDIYFEDKTPEIIRNIFISFVEEHLSEYGIEICENIEITCSCGFSFSEASIRRRISEGFNDIGCPECDKRTIISEGALKARKENPELEQRSWALKTDIQAKKSKIVANVKKEFSKLEVVGTPKGSIWILHLSDLHMTLNTDFISMLQPLISDLNDLKKELGFDRLDYLVISGDLTNCGKAQEFEVVRQFISKIIENFELSAERCIIVPGNHDIDWDESVYDWKAKRLVDVKSLDNTSFVEEGNGYLVRNMQKYPQRFSSFSKNFYHPLIQREYPVEFKDQCIPIPFYEDGLQFLAINSCWEIDEFHQKNSSINLSALSRGLCIANEQIKQFPTDRRILRIAVWHHPVTGNDKIFEDAFLEQLRKENFALCLHGHIHEDRADIIGYLHDRKIRIAGTGSFGIPAYDRPESVPRLYGLLEIARDHSEIKVHTRCLCKEGGAWDGYAKWDAESPTEKRTYYKIILNKR